MAKFTPPIIVLGTGRSGTSLVAGMLYHLGVHMGEDLIPANRTNVSGHFEDNDFASLHQAFLDEKLDKPTFAKNAANLVRVKGIQGRRWGWKIPTTSQLISFYLKHFPDSKVVWVDRPIKDSVASCLKSYKGTKEKWETLIKKRHKNLHKHLKDHLKLQFGDVIKHPDKAVDKLVDYCGLHVTKEQKQEASDMIYDKKATKNAKILIAVPSYSLSLHASVHSALTNIGKDERYQTHVSIYQGQPVSHNRNKIVQDAKKYDFVLMLDDDVCPTQSPLDLIELNKDIIGLPTPIMQNSKLMYNAVIKVGKNFKPVPGRLQKGLMEVDSVGTGCMIVKSSVFGKIKKPFEFEYDKDGLKTRGEDFAFCQKAKKAGFKIWTHFDYPCQHWKKIETLKILKAFANVDKLSNK